MGVLHLLIQQMELGRETVFLLFYQRQRAVPGKISGPSLSEVSGLTRMVDPNLGVTVPHHQLDYMLLLSRSACTAVWRAGNDVIRRPVTVELYPAFCAFCGLALRRNPVMLQHLPGRFITRKREHHRTGCVMPQISFPACNVVDGGCLSCPSADQVLKVDPRTGSREYPMEAVFANDGECPVQLLYLLLRGEIIQGEKADHIDWNVHRGIPFREALGKKMRKPHLQQPFRFPLMLLPRHAAVGDLLRKQAACKVLRRKEQQRVVFRKEPHHIVPRLVYPVAEAQQSLFYLFLFFPAIQRGR